MSAEEEKDVAAEAAEEPKAAKKAAAKKAPAKKAAAEGESTPKAKAAKKAPAAKAAKASAAAEEDESHEGENAPEKQRRRKKPAAPETAAPGDAEEAKEAAKAKPKARSARAGTTGAKTTSRRRIVKAHARYVRTSARKARMVCGHLRGKSVQEARAILAFTPREVARDWSKLLESAVANAESNHELLEDDLIVREAYADEGPTIKRFRPRAMGRATTIRKRTSHLTITLTPRPQDGATKRQG